MTMAAAPAAPAAAAVAAVRHPAAPSAAMSASDAYVLMTRVSMATPSAGPARTIPRHDRRKPAPFQALGHRRRLRAVTRRCAGEGPAGRESPMAGRPWL